MRVLKIAFLVLMIVAIALNVVEGTAMAVSVTISGAVSGSYTLNNMSIDSNGNITLNVSSSTPPPPGALTLSYSPTTLLPGTVNVAYNQTVTMTASGGTAPYKYDCSGSGVAGITAHMSTTDLNKCIIDGTPTASGTYMVNFSVTDSANATVQASTSFNVNSVTSSISYKDLVPAYNGSYYQIQKRFESIEAYPAQRFYRVTLPSACKNVVQFWLAGSVLNVDMVVSESDFGSAKDALSIYDSLFLKYGNDTFRGKDPATGYWVGFSGSPESESIYIKSSYIKSSVYYIEVVNKYNYSGTYNIEIDCW